MREPSDGHAPNSRPGRTFVTLGAGEMLSRVIGFAGTIFLARQLGVEMYGVMGLGFAVLLYATIAADCGLEYTGPREVVDAGPRLPALVSTVLVTRMLVTVVVAAIQLGLALLLDEPEQSVLALYALALVPVGLNVRWAHLGLERAGVVAVARVGGEVLRLAIVFALVRTPSDVIVVPLAQFAGDAFAAVLLLARLRVSGVPSWGGVDIRLAVSVVRRALPMLASAALAMVIYNSDLIFLRVFRDSGEVGQYLAAYTLLNFLGVLGHLIALSLTPAFTHLRPAPAQQSALLQRSLVNVMALGLPIAAGGVLTAPQIIGVAFGADYSASAPVLALLIWCLPILLYRSVMQAALVSMERPADVLRTTVVAAVANVALNLVAVPLLGMLGAAITTVVAEALRAATARAYVRRAGFRMPGLFRYGRAVGSVLAMVAVLLIVRPVNLWIAVALAVPTYALVLMAVGGLRVRRDGIQLST